MDRQRDYLKKMNWWHNLLFTFSLSSLTPCGLPERPVCPSTSWTFGLQPWFSTSIQTVSLMQHLCLSNLHHNAGLCMPISQQTPLWKIPYRSSRSLIQARLRPQRCNSVGWPQLFNTEEKNHSPIMKVSGSHASDILNAGSLPNALEWIMYYCSCRCVSQRD